MSPGRILVVEDSDIQAKSVRSTLENRGYEVAHVTNGASAIKEVVTSGPDLVLLDLVLPDMSGKEVCRWLKSNAQTKGIPIIMLTVKDALEDKVSGIEAGADDYLAKPCNEIELNAKIYAALRTKALQDELRQKNKILNDVLEKMESLAVTDSLTGLFNRRHVETVLGREWRRKDRYGHPIGCLLMDIDHFKMVNDEHGHKAGDLVLSETARIFRTSLREVDTVARWGGEEFLGILPQTNLEQGMIAAERIRKNIAEHEFGCLPGRRVTVSIGFASSSGSMKLPEELIHAADFALYTAKRGGRNRVEAARD